jgi:hypothetical protein
LLYNAWCGPSHSLLSAFENLHNVKKSTVEPREAHQFCDDGFAPTAVFEIESVISECCLFQGIKLWVTVSLLSRIVSLKQAGSGTT